MKTFFKSFGHAVAGILFAFKNERNFQVEIVGALLALVLLVVLPLSIVERVVILMTIAFVLALELLNTAFEHFLDLIKPDESPIVKNVKDLVAGSVLIAALLSLLVGFLVFFPHLW